MKTSILVVSHFGVAIVAAALAVIVVNGFQGPPNIGKLILTSVTLQATNGENRLRSKESGLTERPTYLPSDVTKFHGGAPYRDFFQPASKSFPRRVLDELAALPAHRVLFEELSRLREDCWSYLGALCGKDAEQRRDPKKLVKPKKQDFVLAVSTKQTSYDAGDGHLSVDHEKHSLTWTVSENNRAVEHARSSYMGQVLFGLLAKVEWTRGSGGDFAGNDEYSRDNRESGGGANYVTQSFRMKTKDELAAAARSRQGYSFASRGHAPSLRRF